MTTLVAPRTNGEAIQPFVDGVKTASRRAFERAKEHPDELAVGAVPLVVLTLATFRHKLNLIEAALIAECSFWGGVLAVRAYRQWKDEPAGTVPRLRKVTLWLMQFGSSWPGSSRSA
jgi:hypothetical protein